MSGFQLSGDPYNWPGQGGEGWLEYDSFDNWGEEDSSEPEEDPSENENEENPAGEPEGNEPEPDSDDAESEYDSEDAAMWPTDEEYDADDDSEDEADDGEEVINPPHPVRDISAPPPEPSLQMYQHPGGTRWKHTARKTVTSCRKRDISPPASPRPTKRKLGLPLSWGAGQHVPSTYEVGESSRGPPTTHRNEAQPSPIIPVLVERLARYDNENLRNREAQVTTETTVQDISRRVQSLEEDRNLDEEAIQITRDELRATRMQLAATETRLADTEQQLAMTELRVEIAEQRVDEVHQELAELKQRLESMFGFQ